MLIGEPKQKGRVLFSTLSVAFILGADWWSLTPLCERSLVRDDNHDD